MFLVSRVVGLDYLQNGDDLAHLHLKLLNFVKKGRTPQYFFWVILFVIIQCVVSKSLMQRFVIRSLESGDSNLVI